MKTKVSDGLTWTFTAAGTLAAGDIHVIGTAFWGVLMDDYVSGDTAVMDITDGIFDLTKEAPLVISAGDLVYWDTTAKEVDKTATNLAIGVAAADAASAATTVRVKLFRYIDTDT